MVKGRRHLIREARQRSWIVGHLKHHEELITAEPPHQIVIVGGTAALVLG